MWRCRGPTTNFASGELSSWTAWRRFSAACSSRSRWAGPSVRFVYNRAAACSWMLDPRSGWVCTCCAERSLAAAEAAKLRCYVASRRATSIIARAYVRAVYKISPPDVNSQARRIYLLGAMELSRRRGQAAGPGGCHSTGVAPGLLRRLQRPDVFDTSLPLLIHGGMAQRDI